MESVWDKAIKVAAAIAGAISGIFGGWDSLMTALLAFLIVDYLSGIIVAWMGKSLKTQCGGLSSKVGAVGLAKKGLMLMVVLIGALLDQAISVDGHMFRDAVCWFYMANEGISIMENLALAGVPFPDKLMRLLGIREKTKAENERDK